MAEDKVKDGQQIEDSDDIVEEPEDGADQNKGGKSGGDDKPDNDGAGGKQQPKTFTQEQVNRMMTREKNQGRAAALKELGIDPKDTKAMAMVKALIDSQKTDEQKAAEKAAEDSAKQAEAERRAMVAEIKAEAMMLDAQPQYVDDIVALVMAKMGASEDADAKTIIGEYKTKYPLWFKESEEDDKGGKSGGKKAGQKGTGTSVKSNSGGKSNDGAKSLGARLAAQRKTHNKTSYWGGNKR